MVFSSRFKTLFSCTAGFLFLGFQLQVIADNQDDALTLLQVTNAATRFDQAAASQTAAIVRTFASIVNMSSNVILPEPVRLEISSCYLEEFAWSRFESGFAQIFAANLSAEELALLIDFFSARSIPPPQIDQFRQLITKASAIELQAADLMFAQTESCDRNSVQIIRRYLAENAN
jgi:hypothetical protein